MKRRNWGMRIGHQLLLRAAFAKEKVLKWFREETLPLYLLGDRAAPVAEQVWRYSRLWVDRLATVCIVLMYVIIIFCAICIGLLASFYELAKNALTTPRLY